MTVHILPTDSNYIMIKTILFCITLGMVSAAWGQDTLVNGTLVLDELNQPQGKYVLCANFQTPEKDTISHVVIGDTFNVESNGEVFFVVISNACVLNTRYGQSLTNDLNQWTMHFPVYSQIFPADTKLIVHNSVYELSKVTDEYLNEHPSPESGHIVYEGQAALDQLRKMGLKPPPDMDTNEADWPTNAMSTGKQ
jgi:hypothetical protein